MATHERAARGVPDERAPGHLRALLIKEFRGMAYRDIAELSQGRLTYNDVQPLMAPPKPGVRIPRLMPDKLNDLVATLRLAGSDVPYELVLRAWERDYGYKISESSLTGLKVGVSLVDMAANVVEGIPDRTERIEYLLTIAEMLLLTTDEHLEFLHRFTAAIPGETGGPPKGMRRDTAKPNPDRQNRARGSVRDASENPNPRSARPGSAHPGP